MNLRRWRWRGLFKNTGKRVLGTPPITPKPPARPPASWDADGDDREWHVQFIRPGRPADIRDRNGRTWDEPSGYEETIKVRDCDLARPFSKSAIPGQPPAELP